MDPSYNNSFGSSQGPITSGTGDIVLASSGGKKSKKGLIIGILVAVVLVVVGVVVGVMMGQSGDIEKDENAKFHTLLQGHMEDVAALAIFVKWTYDGEVSLENFLLSEEEYEKQIKDLNSSIEGLNVLSDRLEKGPALSGTFNDIDLESNYLGLKTAMENDAEKYRLAADVTKKIYEIFESNGELSAVSVLDEYYGMGNLAVEIDRYFESRNDILDNYADNDCNNVESEICNNLAIAIGNLNDATSDIKVEQSYRDMLGDFKYDGEGSVIECLNALYAGTEVLNVE